MRRMSLWVVLAVAAVSLSGVVPTAASGAPLPPVCETTSGGALVAADCAPGTVGQVGEATFEPTMGAGPDGSLLFATTPARGIPAGVGFGASISRSTDGGTSWKDVGARVAGQRVPLETNDPYIYVDPTTGRIFEFHMAPILTCAQISFSDDGGATWTNNPVGCGPTGAWDHQTMVAAKPRFLSTTNGYPNILHQCVNAVYAEMCSRSLDGGLTWSPSTVAWPNDKASSLCGTQTGHLAAAPDGVLYLPTSDCGTFPTVGISTDDGLTWKRVRMANVPMPFDDPAVAVDADGVVYATFFDALGQLHFLRSADQGATWTAPVKVTTNQVTAGKVSMVVGDAGKVAIAFVGTGSIPGQYAGRSKLSSEENAAVRWGAFLTTSLDALSDTPTFTTTEVTGTDPLMQSTAACGPGLRCAYIVDFIGSAVTPQGRPYGAFVDGCTAVCAVTPGARNNVSGTTGRGVVASVDVDLCEARCPQFGPAPAGAPASTAPLPPGTGAAGPQLPAGASPVPGMATATYRALAAEALAERQALAAGAVGTAKRR
jgi:hypothetical protein